MFCRIEDYGVDFDYYSYNPCYPFSRVSAFGGCKNVAACVYNNSMDANCDIGNQENVRFSFDGVNVIAIYNGIDCGLGSATTVVTLICDPDIEFTEGRALGELSDMVFGFSLRSKKLCSNAGNMTTAEPNTTATTAAETNTTAEPITFTTVITTEEPNVTSEPFTASSQIPFTSPGPGIFCDYKTLLGQTLRLCIEERTGNTITPFAPLYLNRFGDISSFCSNLTEINTCIQDSIASCAFDSRVTTFFGESGLGLQAAYDSICAHPFSARDAALECVTYRDVEDYRIPLNNFITYVDGLSDPDRICSLATTMVSQIQDMIGGTCGTPGFPVWTLFWDNFMAGCQ